MDTTTNTRTETTPTGRRSWLRRSIPLAVAFAIPAVAIALLIGGQPAGSQPAIPGLKVDAEVAGARIDTLRRQAPGGQRAALADGEGGPH